MSPEQRRDYDSETVKRLRELNDDLARLKSSASIMGTELGRLAQALVENPEYAGLSEESSFDPSIADVTLQVAVERKHLDADRVKKLTDDIRRIVTEQTRLRRINGF